jgi:hypothetical protein
MFAGYNYVTPYILGYYYISHRMMWIELSTGAGSPLFDRLYGVTVRVNGKDLVPRLSECFRTEPEAMEYIASLNNVGLCHECQTGVG